jgi:hypothetical protein
MRKQRVGCNKRNKFLGCRNLLYCTELQKSIWLTSKNTGTDTVLRSRIIFTTAAAKERKNYAWQQASTHIIWLI